MTLLNQSVVSCYSVGVSQTRTCLAVAKTIEFPSPYVRLQANHSIAEEKAGGGDAAAAARGAEVGGSPPRRGDKAGRTFQRRLEEASAEAYAESAAAPQIAAATGVTRAEEWGENNGLSCGVAVAGGIGRESTEAMKGVDRQPTGGGGDGVHGGWTEWEDGRLKRLVRECVFDFDLVAARLSSPAAAVDGDGGESGGDDYSMCCVFGCCRQACYETSYHLQHPQQ